MRSSSSLMTAPVSFPSSGTIEVGTTPRAAWDGSPTVRWEGERRESSRVEERELDPLDIVDVLAKHLIHSYCCRVLSKARERGRRKWEVQDARLHFEAIDSSSLQILYYSSYLLPLLLHPNFHSLQLLYPTRHLSFPFPPVSLRQNSLLVKPLHPRLAPSRIQVSSHLVQEAWEERWESKVVGDQRVLLLLHLRRPLSLHLLHRTIDVRELEGLRGVHGEY